MPFLQSSLCLFTLLTIAVVCLPCRAMALIDTPTSPNSLEVRERISPELERIMAEKGVRLGAAIFIRIFKESDELEMWVMQGNVFKLLKIYTICDYSGTLGPKEHEGDKQSPEGFYQVGVSQLNPWSKFHLAFDIGYPNDYDRALGRTGKSLMVHGRCSSVGCFAMTDYRMEEIYTLADAALAGGQETFAVHIFPFRMTEKNMLRYAQSPWQAFWQNLKEGYDLFEQSNRPPQVTVKTSRYIFTPAYIELARTL